MGWRFRKSIGGKYIRFNLGKRGFNSVTFGGRGMPHITMGRTGTRVGASIPGTGIYYTHRIDGRQSQAPTTQHIDTTPTLTMPTQAQTATPPPVDGGTPRVNTPGHRRPLPWSRLAISSLVLGLGAVLCFVFNGFAPAALLSLIALPLGVAALIVIQLRKSRRGTLLAVCGIILSIAMLVASAERMPSSTSATPSAPHSVSASQKAAQIKSKEAAQHRLQAQKLHEQGTRQ